MSRSEELLDMLISAVDDTEDISHSDRGRMKVWLENIGLLVLLEFFNENLLDNSA